MGFRKAGKKPRDSHSYLHAVRLRDADAFPQKLRKCALGRPLRVPPGQHCPRPGPGGNARRPERRASEDQLGSDKDGEQDDRQSADQIKRDRTATGFEFFSPTPLSPLAHARTLTAIGSRVAQRVQRFRT